MQSFLLEIPALHMDADLNLNKQEMRCVAGPFVSVLFSRLENMLENSLQVNLLLTGIIGQLAVYSQPLLRSFLLNTNMVFQPSVRSLYQVTEH